MIDENLARKDLPSNGSLNGAIRVPIVIITAVLTSNIGHFRRTRITGKKRIILLAMPTSVASVGRGRREIVSNVLRERSRHEPGSDAAIRRWKHLLTIGDLLANNAEHGIDRLEEILEVARVRPWNGNEKIIECNQRRWFVQFD